MTAFSWNVSDTPDALEYFFLRSKAANGYVAGFVNDSSGNVILTPQAISSGSPDAQLFKYVAINPECAYVLLVNKQTGLALAYDAGCNKIIGVTPDPNSLAQQWALSGADQLINAAAGGYAALSLQQNSSGNVYLMTDAVNTDPSQMFEMVKPGYFVFVRHCWTGRFLTADDSNNVTWQLLNCSAYQEWGITSDGFLFNQATSQVLQLSGSTPAPGQVINLGPQVAFGNADVYQRFNVNTLDGAIHSMADENYVIGKQDTSVVSVPFSATDYTQLIEFISPYQFFNLQNQGSTEGVYPFLARSGNSVIFEGGQTQGVEQVFTVSRYGEIISPMDGYVLQSQGFNVTPQFVDPAPDPIGYDSTTFIYSEARSSTPGTGTIEMRSMELGLLNYGEHSSLYGIPIMYSMVIPAAGSEVWQLVAPNGDTFMSQYMELTRAFFSNPCPLPGQAKTQTKVDSDVAALAPMLDKTTRVIIAIIKCALDLLGMPVASVSDQAALRVAQIMMADAGVAAKIGVIMRGTVNPSSIMAVLQAMSFSLWSQVIREMLPSSFWGWVISIGEITVTIAGWAVGAGPAIVGARLTFLAGEIIMILNEDPAQVLKETRLLETYLEQRQQTQGRATALG